MTVYAVKKNESQGSCIWEGTGCVAGDPEGYPASNWGNREGYFNYLNNTFPIFKIKAMKPSGDVALENV